MQQQDTENNYLQICLNLWNWISNKLTAIQERSVTKAVCFEVKLNIKPEVKIKLNIKAKIKKRGQMKCPFFSVNRNNIWCRMGFCVAVRVSLSTENLWKSTYNLPITYSIWLNSNVHKVVIVLWELETMLKLILRQNASLKLNINIKLI